MNTKKPLNLAPQDLKKWLSEDPYSLVLVDVRETEEVSIASITKSAIHLPLSQSVFWSKTFSKYLSFQKPIVVFCHSGVRSWNFGVWLIEQDHRYEVWNLEGGIDAWSQEVDSSVPRY